MDTRSELIFLVFFFVTKVRCETVVKERMASLKKVRSKTLVAHNPFFFSSSGIKHGIRP